MCEYFITKHNFLHHKFITMVHFFKIIGYKLSTQVFMQMQIDRS